MEVFRCKKCGQKIVFGESGTDEKECPRCGVLFFRVPPNPVDYDYIRDAEFLDIPPQEVIKGIVSGKTQATSSEEEVLDFDRHRQEDDDKIQERSFPWVIDIFLYPTSSAGLTMLGIIILVPLLLDVVIWLFGLVHMVLGMIVSIPFIVVRLAIGLYFYWYWCECIRDSALGCVRAQDVLENQPWLGDMFWRYLKIGSCLVLFGVAPLIYAMETGRTDFTFMVLLGFSVFLFPMGILSVVMFDSLSGLNPIVIIGSVFSTFLPYCAMVVSFFVSGYLIVEYIQLLPNSPSLRYLLVCASIYLSIVIAHVLGWFYYHFQKQLNWEV